MKSDYPQNIKRSPKNLRISSKCPDCESALVFAEGSCFCPNCGFSEEYGLLQELAKETND